MTVEADRCLTLSESSLAEWMAVGFWTAAGSANGSGFGVRRGHVIGQGYETRIATVTDVCEPARRFGSQGHHSWWQ